MRNALKKLTTWFVSGLVTLLPLVITVGLLAWIYSKLVMLLGSGSSIGKSLTSLATALDMPQSLTIALSYALIIAVIVLIGAYVQKRASNTVAEMIKRLMNRFPVVNSIYNSIEQVVGIFHKEKDQDKDGDGKPDSEQGSSIVLVRWANTLILGMLPTRDVLMLNGEPHYMVYFPQTPVPMSGLNFVVPAADVFMTDLKFDDLTKILVSLGALTPQLMGGEMDLVPFMKVNKEMAAG